MKTSALLGLLLAGTVAAPPASGGIAVQEVVPVPAAAADTTAAAEAATAADTLLLAPRGGLDPPATPDRVEPSNQPAIELDPMEALGLVDELVWTAAVLRQLLGERDYPALLVTSALTRALDAGDEAVLEGLQPLLGALMRSPGAPGRLGRCRDEDHPVEGALCSLEELMPLAPSALRSELTEEGARLVGLYLTPGEPPLAGVRGAMARELGPSLDPFQRFAEETLHDAWHLRTGAVDRADGMVATFDELLSSVVGFAPREGADQILSRVPDLHELVANHSVLSALGDAPGTTTGFVLGEYQAFLGAVTGSLGEFLSAKADTNLGVVGRASIRIDDAMTLLSAGVDSQARQALDWATQRSFVFLASRSAALTGAEEGVSERIRALGNAAVDLQLGAAGFSTNLAWLGRDMAMAALSGNVFAVAAGITAFFDGAPGSLGPSAASEVRALREGIEAVRAEIHDRFDEVDEQFDSLFMVLDNRFGRLESLVASNSQAVRLEIASLHQELVGLGERLDHMEENLHSYIQAGFDRDYSRTLVRCLEHRDRFLPPFDEMGFPVFSECLADFRTRAVQDARDALLTDQSTPVDDLSLVAALADPSVQNLARRLPLLGRAAEQRFGYAGLRGGRGLANPVEWAVASQAYLTLLQEWPEHARAVAPGDLEAMRSVGLLLQDVLRGVTVDLATGDRGLLLRQVLGYYEDRVAELTAEADVLAHRHQQAELRRVPSEALLNRIEATGTGRPSLEVPSRVASGIPQEVWTAAVLALGDASLVYRLATEDSISRENPRRRMLLFGRRHDRLTFTRTRIEVELRFGELGVLAVHRADGPFVLRRIEEMKGAEGSEQVLARVERVPDPAEHFLGELWPALLSDPIAWEVSSVSPAVLQLLERRIEEELRQHATRALNGVFTAVCEDGPVGTDLVGGDVQSALRIRSALDGLSAARALLESYVRLAFPFSAESDPELREALFGPEAILDRSALCQVVAAGESPLRLVWLEEEPRRRATVLSGVLTAVLAREGEAPEPLPLVELTLQQLDAAIRVQRLRTMVARLDR